MPPSYPERQRTLGSLLRQPYRALQDRTYAALAQRGFDDLRAAHSAVFRHIRPEGSRVTELAAQAGMTKQSMSYLVDALVRGGYLHIVPDPADGRAKLARLTLRGEQAMAALIELSLEWERRLARRLGAAKVAQLRELLEETIAAVERDGAA
ncbi:MAG TPA: MarR family transcriptional regulator [Pseudoxanthomonas sp.]|nr:MarR family transcriptional regulator [Pseudoxanthomonas sp.]